MRRSSVSVALAAALAGRTLACGGSTFTEQSGVDAGPDTFGASSGAGSSSGSAGGSGSSGSASGSSGGSASSSGASGSGSSSGHSSGSSGSSSSGVGSSGTGSSGAVDASIDAGTIPPPSCVQPGPGRSNCGTGAGESCCASLEVAAGAFYRSYDGVSAGYTTASYPATLAGFRLDKYEITVGRFRQFVNAVVGGWTPLARSGIHSHLNAGQGLANSAATGTFETGWDATWNANLATTASAWTTNLQCQSSYQTWTPAVGPNENHPINCETWFEAYAFCIWDGGFLPSEAEWNYAAAGGTEQRVFPWSNPPTSATIDCTYANYNTGSPCTGLTSLVGSESPKGDGKWGHTDLAGNTFEWTMDWSGAYVTPCINCAALTMAAATTRVIRGGDFGSIVMSELTSFRGGNAPTNRYSGYVGARCARAP